MKTGRFSILLLTTFAALNAGCTSTNLLRDPGALIGRPKMQQQVNRILCLWEPSQGTGLEGKPARGFAGQLMFFSPGSPAASRVTGAVRITQYDRFDPEADEHEALHTFDFDAESWDVHRTEGSLGHSYSVFIPYMQQHKDPVNCALKVEFIGKDGQIVASDMTEVILPGRKAMATTTPFQRNVNVQSNRAQSTAIKSGGDLQTEPESGISGLKVESIALPRGTTSQRQ